MNTSESDAGRDVRPAGDGRGSRASIIRAPEEIRVLHVDDEPDVAELARTYLERSEDRLEVESVTSTSEGLDRLAEADYDCVLSDYDMPGSDGLEFLETVRDEHGDLPFILFTGKGSEEIASDAIARGVTDYLQKGVGTDQYEILANRIENAVAQQRATQRAAELERIRRVVRNVNQALVRATSREAIERRVCETLSEADPYVFAWIGEVDDADGTVRPRAAAGVEKGYLDDIEIADEGEAARGPTGRAVRTRELAVVQDIPDDPDYEPWREAALDRGYRSSAAVPLRYDDTLYGVLNLYAASTYAFDEQEQELLSEMAEDVAHAIYRARVRSDLRRHERILENLPVGVYRSSPDADGAVLEANPALADIVDAKNPADLVGRSVSSFYADLSAREDVLERLDSTGAVRAKEVAFETLAGERIWVSVTAHRVEENGDTYFDGILRDVTTERRRKRDLRRFREAVEASGHSIYFTDTDGTIEYVNPTFEETTGYTAEEATGRTPRILKSGEHGEEFYEEMWETILEGEVWRNELVNTTKDGEEYVVDQTVAPVTDESGEVEHFVAVNADITQREERERELERSRAHLRALFENSPDPIVIHDRGEILEANQQTAESFGYTPQELRGMDVSELQNARTREELESFWSSLDVGDRVQVKSEVLRKDGTPVPAEISIAKVGLNGEERIIALGRDFSDQRERERNLERRVERLRELVDETTHDLRNAFNVAGIRLELANEDCDTEHIEPVAEALARSESLVAELADQAHENGDSRDAAE